MQFLMLFVTGYMLGWNEYIFIAIGLKLVRIAICEKQKNIFHDSNICTSAHSVKHFSAAIHFEKGWNDNNINQKVSSACLEHHLRAEIWILLPSFIEYYNIY